MPRPVIIAPNFKKVLEKKPAGMQAAILECIERLLDNPAHPGLKVKLVRSAQGKDRVYEARVDKANRLTFHWEDGAVVLRNNCNHSVLDRNP